MYVLFRGCVGLLALQDPKISNTLSQCPCEQLNTFEHTYVVNVLALSKVNRRGILPPSRMRAAKASLGNMRTVSRMRRIGLVPRAQQLLSTSSIQVLCFCFRRSIPLLSSSSLFTADLQHV